MADLVTRVPAVNASSAAAFPLGVSADGTKLRLGTARGAVRLDFAATEPSVRFREVAVALSAVDDAASGGFVDDLAEWLGTVPAGPSAIAAGPVTLHGVGLGRGTEGSGAAWDGYKLFLSAPDVPEEEGYAELFLRLAPDRTQAQLLEKWSAYRTRLPGLFERLLGLPVRRWADRPLVELGPGDEAAWFRDAVGFAFPPGWTRIERQGSTRLVDPTDEFGFEVSVLEVPPLDAVTLLGLMLEGDPKASGATAAALPHPRLELATAEHAWREADPHRPPGAPEREARCRWLVARGDGRIGFVTFTYWTDDAAVALPHWERAVASLALRPAGRLTADVAGS